MAGLLDMLGNDEALLGLALMSAGSAKPVRTGSAEGLLQSLQFVQGQRQEREDRELKRQSLLAQIEEQKAQAEQRRAAVKKQADLMAAVQSVLGGQGSPSQYGLGGGGVSLGGVRETMTPRPGGLAGASPEQIAALKLQGADLLDIWKAAQTGLEQKPGSYYVKNGRQEYIGDPTKGITMVDGKVTLMPGAADSQAALTTATESAKARAGGLYDLVQGVDAQGRPGYIGTRTSIAEELNRPKPAPSTQDLMAQIQAAMRANGDKSANFDVGGMRGTLTANPQQGGKFATGQSPAEKRIDDTIVLGNQSFMKDLFPQALEGGKAAEAKLTSVQSARQALQQMGASGWGTETAAAVANVLGTLGVPQAGRFAASAQQFQSAAMDRLWTTLNEAKGMQTEGDAARAAQTFAQLKNRPEANQYILDLAQAVAERDKLKAQFYSQSLPIAQQKGDLQEVDREWRKRAPSVFSMPSMRAWSQQ